MRDARVHRQGQVLGDRRRSSIRRAPISMQAATDSPSVDDVPADEPVRRGLAGDAAARRAAADHRGRFPQDLPAGDYVMWRRGLAGVRLTTRRTTTTDVSGAVAVPARWHPVVELRPAVPRPAVGRLQGAVHDRRRPRRVATTQHYAGYGDPTGADGNAPPARRDDHDRHAGLRRVAPAARLRGRPDVPRARHRAARVRLRRRRARPTTPRRSTSTPTTATLAFVAPGDDGQIGTVVGYDVRYRVDAADDRRQLRRREPPRRRRVDAASSPASSRRSTLDGLLPRDRLLRRHSRVRRLPQRGQSRS